MENPCHLHSVLALFPQMLTYMGEVRFTSFFFSLKMFFAFKMFTPEIYNELSIDFSYRTIESIHPIFLVFLCYTFAWKCCFFRCMLSEWAFSFWWCGVCPLMEFPAAHTSYNLCCVFWCLLTSAPSPLSQHALSQNQNGIDKERNCKFNPSYCLCSTKWMRTVVWGACIWIFSTS